MSDPEDGQEWPDRIAKALAAYDETLRAGAAVETGRQYPSALSPSAEPDDFSELQSCLRLLEEVWPRSAGRSSTAQVDRTGLPKQPPRSHRLPATDRQQIGRFAVDRVLGSGGFGVVYLALDPVLNRQVALKIPQPHILASPELLERFRREARIAASLDHPHIVPVYETGADGPVEYLVSAYCPGMNLSDWLRAQQGPVAPRLAAQLIRTLADAVDYSHARGVMHRDLKPSNVLIVPEEASNQTAGRRADDDLPFVARITDFGLAKVAEQGGVETKHSTVLGTPSYMAPEQAFFRSAVVGPHTDVHALGAILYELLAGRPPFAGETALEVLEQVRSHEPVSPRLLRPAIPRDLETICLKCLQKEPVRRFATAHELADELGRFLRGEPIRSRPIGAIDRTLRWCRRRPAVAGLVGMSAAAAVVIVGLLVAHEHDLTEYNRSLTRANDDLANAAAAAVELQGVAQKNERQAKEAEQQAKDAERRTKDVLYAPDLGRAAAAWHDEDTRGMVHHLERHIPRDGEPDRRGFEWWYLHRQARLGHQVLLDVGSPIYFVGASPDRRKWAAAGQDAVVRLIDSETGVIVKEIVTGQIEVNGVAFSPDGIELATAGDDGTIRIVNLQTGGERLKWRAHPGKAFQLLYTPDGRQIVSCGDNPIIRVFDSPTGGGLLSLDAQTTGSVESLVLADDGRTLASAGRDGRARIWDLQDGKLQQTFFPPEPGLGPIALLQDRDLLIIGDNEGLLRTVNIRTNREIAQVKHFDCLGAIAVHPDGALIAVGDRGGKIRLRKIDSTGNFADDHFQPWQAHRGHVYSLVWSDDGSRLVSAGNDGRVVSWSLLAASHDAGPDRIAVESANSFGLIPRTRSLITTASSPHMLARWNWSQGKREELYSGETGQFGSAFDSVQVSPDGKWVAFRRDSVVHYVFSMDQVFSPSSARAIQEWIVGPARVARFSPDSSKIAVTWYTKAADGAPIDDAVWLYDVAKQPGNVFIPITGAKVVAYAPNGGQLAIAPDSEIVLWDILRKSIVWKVSQTDMSEMAFSPDGKLLAAGGGSRLVIIRNSHDGTVQHQFASHRSAVSALAFSPDSATLATASRDGAIKLWHIPTGQELFELRGPGGTCPSLAFAEDGRHLLALIINGDPGRDEILVYRAGESDSDE
jgi:WD40 repeat protein